MSRIISPETPAVVGTATDIPGVIKGGTPIERMVREECARPWRIYRPSIVVGHSQTGAMDKVVMTDSIFSMDGDIAPLQALAKSAMRSA